MIAWAALALALAQDSARPSAEGLVHLADPSLGSAISTPALSAILEGSTTSRTGTARVGLQRGDLLLALTLAGPLDDAEREARPASLKGLSDAATLGGSVSWLSWNPRPDVGRMQHVCDAYFAATGLRADPCAASSLPEGRWRRRFHHAVDYGTPVILSLQGTVGGKTFAFIDTTTLARSSARRTVGSLSAAAGWYRESAGFFLVSYARELAYSAGDAVTVCRPLGTSGATRCDPLRLHGPLREATSLVSLEWRRLFGAGFGIRPQVSYRTLSDTWGWELPVYFLRDERGLTGGVSAGYRTDTREASLRVFVGGVLGLLGPD